MCPPRGARAGTYAAGADQSPSPLMEFDLRKLAGHGVCRRPGAG